MVAVLYFVFEQVRDTDVLMECQPTISHHISFTDFLIKINNGSKSLLIEVKKKCHKNKLDAAI